MTRSRPAPPLSPALGAPRRHAWAAGLMVGCAGLALPPDLFDAGVFKTALAGLLGGCVLTPLLAGPGRAAAGEWFASVGARLLVLGLLLALVRALAHLDEAAVVDRLLLFGLAQLAGALGVFCAERCPSAPATALRLTGLAVALVAWAQALGWEQRYTPDPSEVVGLSGNTTRAGALLALAVLAWACRIVVPDQGPSAEAPSSRRTQRHLPGLSTLCLAVVAGALLLTRARGARSAALAGLAVLLFMELLRRRARAATGAGAPPQGRRRWLALLLGLLLAVGGAAAAGGPDALSGRKLEASAAVLSGRDLTTRVRLSLWGATCRLVAEAPLLGVGLGRFRAEFPPYRDPQEAALPGLQGAPTEAHDPHDEWLRAAAEGGLPAGLCLVLFALLGLRRALRAAVSDPGPGSVALCVLVAGCLLASVQDALTDPGTALPFFLCAGQVWAARPEEPRAYAPTPRRLLPLLALLGVGLLLLAWPRLDSHLSLRTFFLRAQEREGLIGPESFAALLRAGEVGAGDIDIQRLVREYGRLYAPRAVSPHEKVTAIQAVDRAVERLARLSPHAP